MSVPAEDVDQVLGDLRRRFPGKCDDAIIGILRGHVAPDQAGGDDAMAWFVGRLERAKRQREAVDAIQRLGGGIFYDYQKGGICRPKGEPQAPESLRSLLGDHFFVNVVGVGLGREEVGHHGLTRLGAFPDLEFVMLKGPNIDDAGIEHIRGFPRLGYVELRETSVTREGIDSLLQRLPDRCGVEWNYQLVRPPVRSRGTPSAHEPPRT
jgi:hypothetical protein